MKLNLSSGIKRNSRIYLIGLYAFLAVMVLMFAVVLMQPVQAHIYDNGTGTPSILLYNDINSTQFLESISDMIHTKYPNANITTIDRLTLNSSYPTQNSQQIFFQNFDVVILSDSRRTTTTTNAALNASIRTSHMSVIATYYSGEFNENGVRRTSAKTMLIPMMTGVTGGGPGAMYSDTLIYLRPNATHYILGNLNSSYILFINKGTTSYSGGNDITVVSDTYYSESVATRIGIFTKDFSGGGRFVYLPFQMEQFEYTYNTTSPIKHGESAIVGTAFLRSLTWVLAKKNSQLYLSQIPMGFNSSYFILSDDSNPLQANFTSLTNEYGIRGTVALSTNISNAQEVTAIQNNRGIIFGHSPDHDNLDRGFQGNSNLINVTKQKGIEKGVDIKYFVPPAHVEDWMLIDAFNATGIKGFSSPGQSVTSEIKNIITVSLIRPMRKADGTPTNVILGSYRYQTANQSFNAVNYPETGLRLDYTQSAVYSAKAMESTLQIYTHYMVASPVNEIVNRQALSWVSNQSDVFYDVDSSRQYDLFYNISSSYINITYNKDSNFFVVNTTDAPYGTTLSLYNETGYIITKVLENGNDYYFFSDNKLVLSSGSNNYNISIGINNNVSHIVWATSKILATKKHDGLISLSLLDWNNNYNNRYRVVNTNNVFSNSTNIIYSDNKIDLRIYNITQTTLSQQVNLTIKPLFNNINGTIVTWNTTGDYRQVINVSSATHDNPTQFIWGDLPPKTLIQIKKNGVNWNTYVANDTGYIAFDYTGWYSDIQFEASVAVTFAAASIVVIANNTSPLVNTTVTINATVKDSSGFTSGSLGNGTITFLANGSEFASASISSGVASTTYTKATPGTVTITAFYNSTLQNTTTVTFTPAAIPALTVSVLPITVTAGTPTSVTFNVTSSGIAINNATVTLSGVATGSSTTNASGFAVISVNATSAGTITATVSLIGYTVGTTTITASKTGTAAQPQGLVAYWDFNEGSGTIASDSSGNGNTGTIYGATWTAGKMGSALQFNGISNYVDAGKGASLDINGNMTLLAWIKTTSTSENVITGRGLTGSSDHTWGHDVEGGFNTFYLANGYSMGTADSVIGTKLVNDGQWHQVVARANSTRIEVYTDGIYDNGKNKNTRPNSNTNLKVLIGDLPGYSLYFNGIIDDVKIYNRSLSASEIYAEYLNSTSDSIEPYITDTDPTNNAISVPVTRTVTITFSEGIQNGTNFNSISLKDSNNIAIGTVNSITGNVLTIDPSIDLGYNKTYAVSIPAGAIKDSSGNALANTYSFNFTTSVLSILTMIAVSPSSASITEGLTQQYIAQPQDQFGNPMTVSISWSSSNTTVGSITQGGLFSASTPGTTTITASNETVTGTATAVVKAIIATPIGLAAHWNFNEGSGTIASDSSGNGNTGTIYGATWTAGKMGSALQFNGISNYVDAGKGASLDINGNMTLIAWIKTTSTSENVITGRGLKGRPDHTWEHAIEGGLNTFYWANGYKIGSADTLVGKKLVNDGQWHQVVARANSTRIEVYTDGVYDNGKNKNTRPNSNLNLKVLVGNLPGYSLYFNGVIDEVKIYNRTLSASEIYAEYLNLQ